MRGRLLASLAAIVTAASSPVVHPGPTHRYWADDPAFGADPLVRHPAGSDNSRSSATRGAEIDEGVGARLLSPDGPRRGVRGITIGPIESAVHPDKGYGSEAYGRTLAEVVRIGANWISLTPYGRIADRHPTGIDWSFEAPFPQNRAAMLSAIEQAHRRGLRVLLVPHLWVEDGSWRGEIDPGKDAGWARWAQAYRAFLLAWAEVAEKAHADMLSGGVELGSWVTTQRAPTFRAILDDVRRVYHGPITYSANWDDIEATLIVNSLDVIGINGFYPLAERDGAGFEALRKGAVEVAKRVHHLASVWHKPVVFTEFGYTTRPDPAIKPWEWPDRMRKVRVDEIAQATAYKALLAPLLDEPGFLGLFVWRFYADPDDVSQEAEWGFSPRGKRAELVLRDGFRAAWAADGPNLPGAALSRTAAQVAGVF